MSWITVLVIVHVLSAMVWVGGMLFLAIVAVPATRPIEPSVRNAVLTAVGRRFRIVGWIALGLLLTTGLTQAAYYSFTPAALLSGDWLASRFGQLLTAKLGLVVLMAGLTLVHEVGTLRSTTVVDASAGTTFPHDLPNAGRDNSLAANWARWSARLNVVVGILVVILAVLLRRPG